MNPFAAIHSLPMFALGGGVALIGLGLFALTLRKAKPIGPHPTKSQVREQEMLAQEANKLRLGAAILVLGGAGLMLIF